MPSDESSEKAPVRDDPRRQRGSRKSRAPMRRSMIVAGAGDAAGRSSSSSWQVAPGGPRQRGAGHERLDHEPLRSEPSAERRRRNPYVQTESP